MDKIQADVEAVRLPSEQMDRQTTQKEEKASSTSKFTERAKGKGDDICLPMMNSAFKILIAASNELNKELPHNNKIHSFFTHVASLRKLTHTPLICVRVYEWFGIPCFIYLIKADRGLLYYPAPLLVLW